MTLLEEKTSAVVQEEEVLGDEELFYVGQVRCSVAKRSHQYIC